MFDTGMVFSDNRITVLMSRTADFIMIIGKAGVKNIIVTGIGAIFAGAIVVVNARTDAIVTGVAGPVESGAKVCIAACGTGAFGTFAMIGLGAGLS